MVSGKFRVGSKVVTVKYIESKLTGHDEHDEWRITEDQLREEYTPISKKAERILEMTSNDTGT